jgi:hypothetical protein
MKGRYGGLVIEEFGEHAPCERSWLQKPEAILLIFLNGMWGSGVKQGFNCERFRGKDLAIQLFS